MYHYHMAPKRRVYIIHKTHEPTEMELVSNFSKVIDNIDMDITYSALTSRLKRAKKRTGQSIIRLKDDKGNKITVEVREVK